MNNQPDMYEGSEDFENDASFAAMLVEKSDWTSKSDEEKAAIHEWNIAYNERIAAMTPREYLEDKIARFEAKLATTTDEAFARVLRIDIEVSRQELARLK